ncbi:MAG TPA: hypothetical protein VME17_07045 [Bryobacteraceae bacterium]|nr:hypothetical protein [Bryobacteraceae bacterium]
MKCEGLIASMTRFLSLLGLAASLAVAGTWSGVLVDAGCFQSAEDNHNVSDSPVLQDVGFEIRLCHPKARTHAFALVQSDGEELALDSAGNTQAAQLTRQGTTKSLWYVTVNGEVRKGTIAVSSMARSK